MKNVFECLLLRTQQTTSVCILLLLAKLTPFTINRLPTIRDVLSENFSGSLQFAKLPATIVDLSRTGIRNDPKLERGGGVLPLAAAAEE
jgi:hypothetical protein